MQKDMTSVEYSIGEMRTLLRSPLINQLRDWRGRNRSVGIRSTSSLWAPSKNVSQQTLRKPLCRSEEFHERTERLNPIKMMLIKPRTLLKMFIIFWFLLEVTDGRRGRARSRTKSKVQIGLPITGKYRDPESDQYYNNNDGAKILLASHFDYEYVLGHKIAFLCIAKGSPRPHITWFKDGVEIFAHHYLHIHEWPIGQDKVKSKIEIDPATQMDAGVYECTADNMYSIDRRSFKTDFSIAFD